MHAYVRPIRAALCGLVAFVSATLAVSAVAADEPVMYAHYIDVGQGACTLLEFPCGAILIDTGGDSSAHVDSLIAYLKQFFARRADLNKTLAAVFTTHPHIDHTRGLRAVVENFTVTNYIDDGYTTGSGRANPNWLRKEVSSHHRDIKIRAVREEEIMQSAPGTGLTDAEIDPVHCSKCDPVLTVLSGGYETNPGWSEKDFKNLNNQSIVIRVDFGQSSFLFTGDLEEAGIDALLEEYQESKMLDVDVYMVGHHGAANATTAEFVEALTPEIAIMGTGKWDDGKNPSKTFSTYAYGHPRAGVIGLLSDHIAGTRSSKKVMVADKSRTFHSAIIKKSIYATGWDGTIDIKATLDGKYTVTTSN